MEISKKSRSGVDNPFYGKKHSKATKDILALKSSGRKLLLGRESEVAKEYLKLKSICKVSALFGCDRRVISKILLELKVQRYSMSEIKQNYEFNKHFFDTIDTQEKAYFLGFLYADGYLNMSKGTVSLTLHPQDEDILRKFSASIGLDKNLLKDRKYVRFSITNKTIVDALVKHGCTQAKTFTLVFPHFLPKCLYRHFIRGYFDGDGSVTYTVDKKTKKKSAVINFTGKHSFLIEIQKILNKELSFGFTKFFIRYKESHSDIGSVCYGGRKQMIKFYNYLYSDSITFLERKKSKLENLLCL